MPAFLDSKIGSWTVQYQPRLTTQWLSQFLHLHPRPDNLQPLHPERKVVQYHPWYRIDVESLEMVGHYHHAGWLPWQKTSGTTGAQLWQGALTLLRQGFAVPMPLALVEKKSTLSHAQCSWMLRQYLPGETIYSRFHREKQITAELASLAGRVSEQLAQLISAGLNTSQLSAQGILLENQRLPILDWRGFASKADSHKAQLQSFMHDWLERVDYHDLFVTALSRAGIDSRHFQS